MGFQNIYNHLVILFVRRGYEQYNVNKNQLYIKKNLSKVIFLAYQPVCKFFIKSNVTVLAHQSVRKK